ncbi:unnamed protein product, partial [Brassica oleracea]
MARSSAKATIATLLTVICFFLPGCLTHHRSPTTYIVGDEFGWDLSIPADTWASDKTFYAGDILGTNVYHNYFTGTTTPRDCWGGMKLAINA